MSLTYSGLTLAAHTHNYPSGGGELPMPPKTPIPPTLLMLPMLDLRSRWISPIITV